MTTYGLLLTTYYADREQCSARIGADDKVTVKTILNGMIDTISGPVVDKDQKFHQAGWAAGNAASPGLIPMYVGPGSTLGNAMQTGYLAAKDAVASLGGSTSRRLTEQHSTPAVTASGPVHTSSTFKSEADQAASTKHSNQGGLVGSARALQNDQCAAGTSYCANPVPFDCTLTEAQKSKQCLCRYKWEQGVAGPTGVKLQCPA